jgi:uncharacterized protein with von Willebrand factor type A (vWA) domain
MTLVDRHLEFVAALRAAGLPVSLAEGLDAVRALETLGLSDRETVRSGYAATVLKHEVHRPAFDRIFDLFFPALVGPGGIVRDVSGVSGADSPPERRGLSDLSDLGDGPQDLADFRVRLEEALAVGDPELLGAMAREAVSRFGRIQGRGPGEQRWSSYNVGNRVSPQALVERILTGLLGDMDRDPAEETEVRRAIQRQIESFNRLVESDVARRAAEVRGPEYVARHTVRPSIDRLDFTAARKADLVEMRKAIHPLARRLATRMAKQQRSRRGARLDFRRTVRASMQTGGVPVVTHHLPKRPARTDLVLLCDVSGSVTNFANFTLMLVFALREQFDRVRAFTFVDEIHEVTDRFTVGADPAQTLADLADSAKYASLWGRTSYGRAFTRFQESYADALTPRSNLLILGDARSNYTDLALPVFKQMEYAARNTWWLNPEHRRHWGTGDSAAREYGAIAPMVECRNLTQLSDFVSGLA